MKTLQEKEPLLDSSVPVPRIMRSNTGSLAEKAPLCPKAMLTAPTFVKAQTISNGHTLPQAIAHRGYKAAYPENTMAAFKAAVKVGAHAIETDIHLSKDGTVVLSHDKDLKRCFGINEEIIDHDWDYLSKLKTTREPQQPMPRLKDLLEYLAAPGLEDIWILLDIKMDNNADDVMRLIAQTIASVPASNSWSKRVLLGIWSAKYLSLCEEHLPGFPITYIGFSTLYASRFFGVPNVCFNMLLHSLIGPFGSCFRKRAMREGRKVLAWTVNTEKQMRWCIRKELDGVISDDPKKFLEMCKEAELEASGLRVGKGEKYNSVEVLNFFRIWLFAMLFGIVFCLRHPQKVDRRFTVKA